MQTFGLELLYLVGKLSFIQNSDLCKNNQFMHQRQQNTLYPKGGRFSENNFLEASDCSDSQ